MHDEIGPLLAEGRSDAMRRVRETVATYFAELASVARTARRLGVHENTVQYRLQRAADILGRPLRERALELQVALVLARLLPERDDAHGAADGA
jgi:DNA-binding PucR family transcriptional regulator